MSELSPERAQKRTSTDQSEFIGSRSSPNANPPPIHGYRQFFCIALITVSALCVLQ